MHTHTLVYSSTSVLTQTKYVGYIMVVITCNTKSVGPDLVEHIKNNLIITRDNIEKQKLIFAY